MSTAKKTKGKISILNWMGTLFLTSIPGVNLIALICFLIFAKSSSKKTYAAAALIWILILMIALVVLAVVFAPQLPVLAEAIRDQAAFKGATITTTIP